VEVVHGWQLRVRSDTLLTAIIRIHLFAYTTRSRMETCGSKYQAFCTVDLPTASTAGIRGGKEETRCDSSLV